MRWMSRCRFHLRIPGRRRLKPLKAQSPFSVLPVGRVLVKPVCPLQINVALPASVYSIPPRPPHLLLSVVATILAVTLSPLAPGPPGAPFWPFVPERPAVPGRLWVRPARWHRPVLCPGFAGGSGRAAGAGLALCLRLADHRQHLGGCSRGSALGGAVARAAAGCGECAAVSANTSAIKAMPVLGVKCLRMLLSITVSP